MEIEKKFLVKELPGPLEQYRCRHIEQGYLCTKPVVRVRRQDDEYYLTYKGSGKMVREEYNLPLNAEAYAHLISKADGYRITKTRYLIPLEPESPDNPTAYAGLTAELDVFTAPGSLMMAEVEFVSKEQADSFVPPSWFGEEVTFRKEYHNSYMSQFGIC